MGSQRRPALGAVQAKREREREKMRTHAERRKVEEEEEDCLPVAAAAAAVRLALGLNPPLPVTSQLAPQLPRARAPRTHGVNVHSCAHS